MKKVIKIILLVALTSILSTSCKRNIKEDKPKFVMELPDTSRTHTPDLCFEKIKRYTEELNLNKLWLGNDSFELRLWVKVEVLTGGHVYIIKKINNKWDCIHYFYIESRRDFSSSSYLANRTIDTFWVKKLQPKTNWNNFFKQIEKENIYKLPSQDDIKGWENIVEDGITYKVEIATKNKYKFYYYNCPDVYKKKFIECNQMTNILDVFDKEFGFDFVMFGNYKCAND
ncbi:MAG: hypothetical protein WCL51_17610 [Bacteroidota bacterium]